MWCLVVILFTFRVVRVAECADYGGCRECAIELQQCQAKLVQLERQIPAKERPGHVEQEETGTGRVTLDKDEKRVAEQLRGLRGAFGFGAGGPRQVASVKSDERETVVQVPAAPSQDDEQCRCGGGGCLCPHGYEANGNTCRDIDECKKGNPCGSKICFNTNGAYQCEPKSCPSGYTPRVQGKILICTKDVPCQGQPDCVHSIFNIFYAMTKTLPKLPHLLFRSTISGARGREPTQLTYTVDCVKCDEVDTPAKPRDFRVELVDAYGIASTVQVVRQLEGPQEFVIRIRAKVIISSTYGLAFETNVKVVVAPC